ncbi:MAG: hypothetical protein GC192_06865 [Bacteroidetes bacterium]|nr:hypothetical protein [Bacteroidota bacterium]
MSFIVKNLLLTAVFLAFFLFISKKMRTGLTFGEVVGFEFSGFKKSSETTVREWQTATSQTNLTKLEALYQNTRYDFLYIVGYVFLGIFIARLAAGEARIGTANTIAILLLVAGLCDVVENLQILQIIKGNFGRRPLVMSLCAAVKFGLLGVSLVWAVVLGVTQFIRQAK